MLKQVKFERNSVEFVESNILLIGLAVGSGFMLLLPLFKKSAGGVPNLTAAEAVTLINRSNALVLDVRDATEFASGHIAEAMHIPLADLSARIGELKKYQNKPILVNCQRGMRSAKACDILRKAEFTQLSNLQGGLNAWLEAKLPAVTNAKTTSTKTTSTKAANSKPTSAVVKKAAAKATVTEPIVEANLDANADTSIEAGAEAKTEAKAQAEVSTPVSVDSAAEKGTA
jgi:rhodanese-related sulfurtransferase